MPPPIPSLPGESFECPDCDIAYASLDIAVALDRIGLLPARLRAATMPATEAALRSRPDDRTWSALEYTCHLRDVFAVYTIRLYRARVESLPVLEPMLNDLRAARFRYNRRALDAVLAELADNAAGFAEEAARVTGDGWDRVATRLPGEVRTVRWMVRQVMHEGTHHVGDISAVLRASG